MYKFEMVLENLKVRLPIWRSWPQDMVIVGKRWKQNPKEKAGSCGLLAIFWELAKYGGLYGRWWGMSQRNLSSPFPKPYESTKTTSCWIDYLGGNKRAKILRRLMIIQERNGVIQELGSILRLSAKFNECDRSWMRKVEIPVATTLRISSSPLRKLLVFRLLRAFWWWAVPIFRSCVDVWCWFEGEQTEHTEEAPGTPVFFLFPLCTE